MEMPQMISIADLKARGWTQALITLLGEPDVVRRNSHRVLNFFSRLSSSQLLQPQPSLMRN